MTDGSWQWFYSTLWMNTNKCTQVDVFETIHIHNLHLHTDHVCIHRQVHTCTFAPTDTCTCKQVHMCILMHTHAHAHAHTHTHTHTHSHTQSSSLIIIFVFEYYKSIIHSSNSISYNLWYISCIFPHCKTMSLFCCCRVWIISNLELHCGRLRREVSQDSIQGLMTLSCGLTTNPRCWESLTSRSTTALVWWTSCTSCWMVWSLGGWVFLLFAGITLSSW